MGEEKKTKQNNTHKGRNVRDFKNTGHPISPRFHIYFSYHFRFIATNGSCRHDNNSTFWCTDITN